MKSEQRPARHRSAAAALVVGPAAVGLGLAAHLLSGGAAPPDAVLAALTALVSLIAAAAAQAQLPSWAIAVGSGAVQQALHLLFTALAGPNAPLFPSAGHVHHHAGAPILGPAVSPLAIDLHLLVVAHVAAALLTAWLAIAANRRHGSATPPERHRSRDRSDTRVVPRSNQPAPS